MAERGAPHYRPFAGFGSLGSRGQTGQQTELPYSPIRCWRATTGDRAGTNCVPLHRPGRKPYIESPTFLSETKTPHCLLPNAMVANP
jgi:hypothetical protein